METAARFIAEKGASDIAAKLNCRVGAVRQWKFRNRFPRDVWPELMEAYPDLTIERLKKLEAAA